MSAPRSIPFRWILPFGQLALCWFTTAVFVSLAPYSLPFAYYKHTVLRLIYAINIPGALLTVPFDIFGGSYTAWHPAAIDPDTWPAISWPVQTLVFWWVAGRAAEALLNLQYRQLTPRMTRVETVTAFVSMVIGGLLLGVALITERDKIYTNFDSALFVIAGGLWTFLGGLTVVASFRQWRLQRQNRMNQTPNHQGGIA